MKAGSKEILDAENPEADQDVAQRSMHGSELDVSISSQSSDIPQQYMSAEAKAILDSTPELIQSQSMLSELDICETPSIDVQTAQKVQQQNVSLFAEMEAIDVPKDDNLIIEQRGLQEFDRLLTENRDLMDVR